MAEIPTKPYVAFSREAEESRRRFRDFRNKQSLDPVTKMGLPPAAVGAARTERALEGARLQDMQRDLSRANIQSKADAGFFAPDEGQPLGISPDLTNRVRASVQAQKALDPLPPSPQQFMDAAQGRSMGMSPNEFARLKGLRDSGSEALAPYKISDAAFRGGADEMAKMAAERAGQPADREAARLRLVADVPPMAEGRDDPTVASKLRMMNTKEENRAGGAYGAAELAKYDAEKSGERDAARRMRELPLREGETRIQAARIAAGLERPPALDSEAMGKAAVDARVRSFGGEPGRVANLEREYAQIASDMASSLPDVFNLEKRIERVLASVPEASRASEAARLLETLESARAFDRTMVGRLTEGLTPGDSAYGDTFERIRNTLAAIAGQKVAAPEARPPSRPLVPVR